MTASNLFRIELAASLTPRRKLLMRLGLPLLLAMPFALVAMPPVAKSAGLTMLVLFVTLLGSAVAATRRRADGRMQRLALLPIHPVLVWLDMLLAGVVVDVLQIGLVTAVFLAGGAAGVTPGAVVSLAAALAATIVLMDLLGMLIAAVVPGSAEVHLVGALAVGAVAVVSGVFPVPGRLAGVVEVLGTVNPVAMVARQLRAISAGQQAGGATSAGVVLVILLAAVILRAFDLRLRRPHRE